MNGPISSGFGWRMHPIFHYMRLHTGTDFAVGCGTPVHAAKSGRVILAGWAGGYGNRVVIDAYLGEVIAAGGPPSVMLHHSLSPEDGRLAEALMQVNRKTKAIETFLSSQSEEFDIQVKNVSIEDLRKPPYKATVDFEKVFYIPGTHTEARRQHFVANFVFVIKEEVSNAFIPVNPLGLTITYFREDQAFE